MDNDKIKYNVYKGTYKGLDIRFKTVGLRAPLAILLRWLSTWLWVKNPIPKPNSPVDLLSTSPFSSFSLVNRALARF